MKESEVQVPAALERPRRNRYGSVPGLDDEELADPDELERQVMQTEWAPVLALPVKKRQSSIVAAVDESGGVDWGAFGTVDFERRSGAFDKSRYKADKLREELGDVLIMLEIVKRRLPKAKYQVLKNLRMGVIELEHIVNEDMLALARLYMRARRIQREIAELGKAGERRRQERLAAVLA